jgi:hypothetical protein
MRLIVSTILFLHLISSVTISQEWIVPDDKKGILSPFPFTENSKKEGERLFRINCMSCHGTPGKGNYINLVPPPGDPATDKIQRNQDGEIFFKVTQGRGLMPSFKNILTSNDIWNIISYLRSFNSKYVQKVMPVITSSVNPETIYTISFFLNQSKDLINTRVTSSKQNTSVPVEGAGVKIFVKRTFGQLLIDEEKSTDASGIASFSVPKNLPGDTEGNIHITALLSDKGLSGSISKDTILNAGIKVFPQSLVKERAMWNTARKAPVWIIITYSLGVLMVWGFIFLILFKLRDIYIIGKHINNNQAN